MTTCPVCQKVFPSRVKLYTHRSRSHQTHVCELCGVGLSSKANLEAHMVREEEIKSSEQ